MSVFIGKESGKPLVHLTRGHTDLSIIKGPPTTNTILHSDINYTGFRIYEPASSEYTYRQTSDGVYRIEITISNSTTMTRMKNYIFNTLSGNRLTFVAFVNNKILMNRGTGSGVNYNDVMAYSFQFYTGDTFQYTWLPNTTWLEIQSDVPIYSLYYAVFDVDTKGTDILDSFRFSRTSIEITKTSFRIGGVELSNVPFLCFGEVMNPSDYQGDLNGNNSVQFINSVNSTGNYQVDLTNGRALIKRGNKTLIDTNKNLAISGIQNTQTYVVDMTQTPGGATTTIGYLPTDGSYIFTGTATNVYDTHVAPSSLGVVDAGETEDVIIPVMTVDVRIEQGSRKITAYNGSNPLYKSLFSVDELFLTATRVL